MAVKKLISCVDQYHVVIISVLLLTHQYCEALSCSEAEKSISRCSRLVCYGGGYSNIDENGGSDDIEKCCYGLQELLSEIESEDDEQELFCCFKELVGSNNYDNNMGLDSINYLFAECGLNVPFNPYDLPSCSLQN